MQKKAAAKSWEYCQHADAAALVTSNLLILAAMKCCFHRQPFRNTYKAITCWRWRREFCSIG